jgi:NADH:ubiquinone oxidoreductase subunit 6 (subunit J)
MIAESLFLAACALAVIGAFGAAIVDNLFHAALLLGLSLVGVAGLYLFLQADYLACIQLVVYVGGILVLILFGTLFSGDLFGKKQRTPLGTLLLGLLAASAAFVVGKVIAGTAVAAAAPAAQLGATRSDPATLPDAIANHGASLGDLLIGDWLPAFLAASILLTAVLIAAVATVRRFRAPPETTDA